MIVPKHLSICDSFIQARVRPLMSRQMESSHGGVSRGVSEVSSASTEERVREGTGRLSSGRVVSAVGAVLKRPHAQVGHACSVYSHITY